VSGRSKCGGAIVVDRRPRDRPIGRQLHYSLWGCLEVGKCQGESFTGLESAHHVAVLIREFVYRGLTVAAPAGTCHCRTSHEPRRVGRRRARGPTHRPAEGGAPHRRGGRRSLPCVIALPAQMHVGVLCRTLEACSYRRSGSTPTRLDFPKPDNLSTLAASIAGRLSWLGQPVQGTAGHVSLSRRCDCWQQHRSV
jgi:hypothetical protein